MKGIYCLCSQLKQWCISSPQHNGLSSEAVCTQNVFSEYTLMDKEGKSIPAELWLLIILLVGVFEMWSCEIFQCFKMCFSVQLDQSRFWNTAFFTVPHFLHFHCPSERNYPTKQTIYIIILRGLDTCCLDLKNEYNLMNWHFPVEDIPLAILQLPIAFMLCSCECVSWQNWLIFRKV